MVQFDASIVPRYNAEKDFDIPNVFIDWVRTNWTLDDPAPYNATTNPYGILFGLEYVGNHDLVAYCSNKIGHEPRLMSIGGKYEGHHEDISFCFTVRRHNIVAGEELPPEINKVMNYIEDLIDRNPRALNSWGIHNMILKTQRTGEKEIFAQQVFELEFIIRCYYMTINV